LITIARFVFLHEAEPLGGRTSIIVCCKTIITDVNANCRQEMSKILHIFRAKLGVLFLSSKRRNELSSLLRRQQRHPWQVANTNGMVYWKPRGHTLNFFLPLRNESSFTPVNTTLINCDILCPTDRVDVGLGIRHCTCFFFRLWFTLTLLKLDFNIYIKFSM